MQRRDGAGVPGHLLPNARLDGGDRYTVIVKDLQSKGSGV